jgi:hypothetical protein
MLFKNLEIGDYFKDDWHVYIKIRKVLYVEKDSDFKTERASNAVVVEGSAFYEGDVGLHYIIGDNDPVIKVEKPVYFPRKESSK